LTARDIVAQYSAGARDLGEGSVRTYRCYLLSPQNKIQAAAYLDARDDADAVARAQSTFSTSPGFPAVEIWQGKRIVGRYADVQRNRRSL